MPFLREVSLLQFAVFCLVDVLLVAAAAAHDVELGSWGSDACVWCLFQEKWV